MAFVNVPDGWLEADGREGADATDAEQDFLFDAIGLVAAVKAMGDFAVALGVLRQPGVEQDQLDVANLDLPELGLNGAPGKLDRHQHFIALRIKHRGNRQVIEIGVVIRCLLMPVGGQRLLEIALAVKQPDADKRQAHVAGCLAVIPGQNAEAAGVDRQAGVEAKFGTEIGNQVVVLERVTMHVHHARCLVVGVVGRQNTVQGTQKNRVLSGGFQFLLVGALEECLGVVIAGLPKRVRKAGEKATGRAIPAVPEIVGELFQALQPFRNFGVNFKLVNGSGHDGLGSMMSWSCRVQWSPGMTQLSLSSTACMIFSKPASDWETVCCGRP